MTKANRLFFFLFAFLLSSLAHSIEVPPVLEFPEAGMDDPARYKSYRTRFYRDSRKNALQVYINQNSGRVVNLWADAANESLSFTVRDASGGAAGVDWCSKGAEVSEQGEARFVQFSLCATSAEIQIGHLMLASMRKERDFQYFKKDLQPFDSEPYNEPELLRMIEHLEKLPPEEKSQQLKLLKAASTNELRSRMGPHLKQDGSTVSIRGISFDGKNQMWLDFTFDHADVKLDPAGITVRAKDKDALAFKVKVGTDAAALTPLDRDEIFNEAFQQFYIRKQTEASNAYRWLERQVRGMELVCYREKLMAGLPNFATYFGRDTMMSAFMFEPIWSVSMMEHAISSIVAKISTKGEVSHEEALGGQAIRENADEYNKLMEKYFEKPDDAILKQAREIVAHLQRTRENYNMVDDDFQFPVMLGRYIRNESIPAERKRAFLKPKMDIIRKNFEYVLEQSRPYGEKPEALNLVSFRKSEPPPDPLLRKEGEEPGWTSASWRDSKVGYAGGRFAMDVNAIWVPSALEAIGVTLEFMKTEPPPNPLLRKEGVEKAMEAWRDSARHFWVRLSRDEYLRNVEAKLKSLPENESAYWKQVLARSEKLPDRLEFLALSLDENGKPIPVLNTDPATWLFLENHTQEILQDREQPGDVYKLLNGFFDPYPAGLFVAGLGLPCANDANASPAVWEKFENDQYHSPRVVWGREMNLLTLGLMKEIVAARKAKELESYVETLDRALSNVRKAVEESGLKHNELWSYQIENGKLKPVRYGSSSDVQLWNLTDLSIQFLSGSL